MSLSELTAALSDNYYIYYVLNAKTIPVGFITYCIFLGNKEITESPLPGRDVLIQISRNVLRGCSALSRQRCLHCFT